MSRPEAGFRATSQVKIASSTTVVTTTTIWMLES